MKRTLSNFGFLVLFTVSTFVGTGQNRKEQNPTAKDSSYVSVAVNFISDAVFMGRRDSVSAPYLYPSITYRNKSGFYATGSFSFLTKSDQSRIDLFLVTTGYDFNIEKLSGDFSMTKYFFNEESYNVISEVDIDISAILTYDFDVLNVGLSSGLFVNKNSSSDFFLSSEISHDVVSSNQKFQISPTAGAYFGSQNFYQEYYASNRFGNGGRGQGQGQGQGSDGQRQTATSVAIEESDKFSLMAFEFSVPIWYVQKQFTTVFIPMLVLPQSKATIVVNDIIVEENLDETFYWIIGLSYQF